MTHGPAAALVLASIGAAAGANGTGIAEAITGPAGAHAATACELRLSDPRSGRELRRLPLDPLQPEVRIAFEHSVLGTTVVDRYRFTPTAVLVEEEFEGEGYGLPAAPGPGERLERVGSRQRLMLSRPVEPLVVRPAGGTRTRLLQPDGELLLASLGSPSVAFEALGCRPLAR